MTEPLNHVVPSDTPKPDGNGRCGREEQYRQENQQCQAHCRNSEQQPPNHAQQYTCKDRENEDRHRHAAEEDQRQTTKCNLRQQETRKVRPLGRELDQPVFVLFPSLRWESPVEDGAAGADDFGDGISQQGGETVAGRRSCGAATSTSTSWRRALFGGHCRLLLEEVPDGMTDLVECGPDSGVAVHFICPVVC